VTLHPEVLGRDQRRVLERVAPLVTARGFYLGGGTALALQLGHRTSVTFGWFREQQLLDPLRLAQELREAGMDLTPTQVEPGTLHGWRLACA
jgi:hypothetical protein